MNTAVITDMMQEGMWVVIQIAAPMLLLSMFVGWMMDKLIEYTETLYTLIRS